MLSHRAFYLATIVCFFLINIVSGEPGPASITALAKEKAKVKRQVNRDFRLPITSRYLTGNYSIQNAAIKVYPSCFFTGSSIKLSAKININDFIALDTIGCYASIYINNKLSLIATANKFTGDIYSFYPVDPPTTEKDKGLGSVSSDDVNIKLIQAAASHSETAFFFHFHRNELRAPNIIGFYKGGKIYFIDENQIVYKSFNALIEAKYGSLENFRKDLAEEEEASQERKRKGVIIIR